MKVLKRNAVIIAVLLFVSVAVYLNWSYNQDTEAGDMNNSAFDEAAVSSVENAANSDVETIGKDKSAGLYYTGDEIKASAEELSEYFAAARLNRQQARYEATETLTTVSETTSASQQTIDDAINRIMQLSDWTVLEAEIENMITAKGFEECVVYISDDGVNVTVPAPVEGLATAAVARITEIVTGNTDFSASELTIVEIKN